jgi:phenylalanyl-tRNA synthetase beta chain
LFDLFPFTDEATIVDLSAFDTSPGTPLSEALGLDDVILEIDNRSLTNRPDLWGHYGIAREISALYGLPLAEFAPCAPQSSDPSFTTQIDDPSRCFRYIGVKIEGLSTKPSPFKVRSRIWRVGMRPINAIVDITNYVMLAVGQPTHAFDSDNIKGHITVRRARDAEKLLLLNGRELSMSREDLVIADDESSVGLAGVMGGAKDSVLPTTDKVILEIADFEAIAIRRTAARHEARTEAAIRYEKSIDPERGDGALSLSMKMFAEFFPDMRVTGFHDNYPNKPARTTVDVSLDWMTNRLGKRIENAEVENMLTRLGFAVTFTPDGKYLHAVVPTWRSTGDVSLPDDIMEEVARLHGFENFEAAPIVTSFTEAINQPEIDIDRHIREYLAFRCGMQEIFSYPWVRSEYLDAIFPSREGMLSISTPPSPDEKYIRSSLLPGLLKSVPKTRASSTNSRCSNPRRYLKTAITVAPTTRGNPCPVSAETRAASSSAAPTRRLSCSGAQRALSSGFRGTRTSNPSRSSSVKSPPGPMPSPGSTLFQATPLSATWRCCRRKPLSTVG